MNYGAVISNGRTAAGLSTQQLARLLHVRQSALEEWELGASQPNLMQIPLICSALHLSYEIFFGVPVRRGRGHRHQSDEITYQYSWLPGMYRYLIHDRRIKRGMTALQLGTRLGLPEKTILSWEAGRTIPQLDEIPKICSVLHIRLWQFFE